VTLSGVINLRMAVREAGEDVVFLHLVERGAADRSYGIQVARLAGVPRPVVERAREILGNLERDEYGRDGLPRRARHRGAATRTPPAQPSLFDVPPPKSESERRNERVLADIRQQTPERLTPLEALQLLQRWHDELGDG